MCASRDSEYVHPFALLGTAADCGGAFFAVCRRKREKKAVPEETAEKTEEERRAEMEMKLFNEGVANILSYGNPKERDR